jgi:hypothetical protein
MTNVAVGPVYKTDSASLPLVRQIGLMAGCLLGGCPVGRDQWGGNRTAGGMSEDNDRCFSVLVLGAFSTGVFQQQCIIPH